jgi:hypothetical protein
MVNFTLWPFYLHRERAPGTHWMGGWVGLRAGLEPVVEKKNSQLLLGLEPPIIQAVV